MSIEGKLLQFRNNFPNLNFVLDQLKYRTHPFLPELNLFSLPVLIHETQVKVHKEGHNYNWLFVYESGIGLARYILDNPDLVRNKTVYDFGTGQGTVALSAAKAGSKHTYGIDSEILSEFVFSINALKNNLSAEHLVSDFFNVQVEPNSVVLASDIWYDSESSKRILPYLYELSKKNLVIVSQPQRQIIKNVHKELNHEFLKKIQTYYIDSNTKRLEWDSILPVNIFSFNKE